VRCESARSPTREPGATASASLAFSDRRTCCAAARGRDLALSTTPGRPFRAPGRIGAVEMQTWCTRRPARMVTVPPETVNWCADDMSVKFALVSPERRLERRIMTQLSSDNPLDCN
jgi:hypothetical protein